MNVLLPVISIVATTVSEIRVSKFALSTTVIGIVAFRVRRLNQKPKSINFSFMSNQSNTVNQINLSSNGAVNINIECVVELGTLITV